MNHARARAWKLHRDALKAPRVTNRVVGERMEMQHDTHCGRCGYHSCMCAMSTYVTPYDSAPNYGGGPGLNAAVSRDAGLSVAHRPSVYEYPHTWGAPMTTPGRVVVCSPRARAAADDVERGGIPPVSQRMGGHGSPSHDRERAQSAEPVVLLEGWTPAPGLPNTLVCGDVSVVFTRGQWSGMRAAFREPLGYFNSREEAMLFALGAHVSVDFGNVNATFSAAGGSRTETHCLRSEAEVVAFVERLTAEYRWERA